MPTRRSRFPAAVLTLLTLLGATASAEEPAERPSSSPPPASSSSSAAPKPPGGFVLHGGASLGGSLSYLRINITHEYTPGVVVAGHVMLGRLVTSTLVIGATVGFLALPIVQRTRVWTDNRPTDDRLGFGFGGFVGATLTALLDGKVAPHVSLGFLGIGGPGLFGGVGPALELGVAWHPTAIAGGRILTGLDARLYLAIPQLWPDGRQFGTTVVLLLGASFASQ